MLTEDKEKGIDYYYGKEKFIFEAIILSAGENFDDLPAEFLIFHKQWNHWEDIFWSWGFSVLRRPL